MTEEVVVQRLDEWEDPLSNGLIHMLSNPRDHGGNYSNFYDSLRSHTLSLFYFISLIGQSQLNEWGDQTEHGS